MASANADHNETIKTTENALVFDQDDPEESELEQGRIWRRGCTIAQTEKQKNSGPVLRTTVKPVKRFRPDSLHEKGTPSPSRKKRIKCGRDNVLPGKANLDESEHVPKLKLTLNASTAEKSLDGKEVSEHDDKTKDEKDKQAAPTSDQPVQECVVPPVKKKRVWEQWTVEDKNYFFDAVAVHGKDFESIRTSIAHKHRKKGENCVAKTKDQVRHLYYRTWTMISKMIDPDAYPININKAFQELYAIINYGEIRKKLGGNLKKKGIEKLNELIRDGTTSMRIKGKNFRIKTPSCKALKKMNPNYQGKQGSRDLPLVSDTRRMKIPLHIVVELFPLNMDAWNQVHSIAHNPRIRIKLSVLCHLSSIFAFLEKKWKPLSSKLVRVGEHCQQKQTSIPKSLLTNSNSKWDRTLVLQTPPDASLNSRIMVFQVTNNKTHCVVSYALRKSLQSREKMNFKEPDNEIKEPDEKCKTNAEVADTTNDAIASGALSESEVVDSCPSSEEDFDYDSAGECTAKESAWESEINLQNDSPQNICEEKHETMSRLMEENADPTLAHDSKPSDEILTSSYKTDEKLENVKRVEEQSSEITCLIESIPCEEEKSNSSVLSEKNCKEQEDMDHCDRINSIPSNTDSVTNSLSVLNTTGTAAANNCFSGTDSSNDHCDIAIANDKDSERTLDAFDSGFGIRENDPPATSELNDFCNSELSIANDSIEVDRGKKDTSEKTDKKLVITTKLFGKSSSKRHTSKKKKSAKAVKVWSTKDCKKTTLAEVFMVLGKPAILRLCYAWIQLPQDDVGVVADVQETSPSSVLGSNSGAKRFSPGLLALIQAAKQTKLAREKAIAEKKAKPPSPKMSVVSKPPKPKTIGIQCELLKQNKVDEKSSNNATSSSATMSMTHPSNPHGRGVSKILPVDTVLVDALPGIGFAIPAVPVNRPRKIAANPAKPVQGMALSEETMNWLLQRERSRNTRPMRKPILVERSKQKKSSGTTYRTMKTFSIVTCGPNKVGFLPSQPILAHRPVPIAPNTSKNTTKPSINTSITTSQATSSQPSTINIDDLLQLDMGSSKQTSNVNSSMDPSNLLAQAAKQAGVAPPTPNKLKTADSTSKSMETVAVPQDQMKQPVSTKETEVNSNAPENGETLDLLREAFEESPASEERPTEADIAISKQSSPTPVLQPSCVSPTSHSVTSVPTTSTIDPLLEFSWSNQSLLGENFPAMTDSLVEKLVHGDGDVVLSSLNTSQNKKSDKSLQIRDVDDNSCGVKLSLSISSNDSFNIHMTPIKSSDLPIHPWTINTNSRESLGLSGLLNTPQKVLPSDSEDSMDGLLMAQKNDLKNRENHSPSLLSNESKKTDSKPGSQDQHSISNFLSETEPEVDIQLQCMLNENSVDYISKFQDLVRQTTDCDELSVIAADENARDGHISPLPGPNAHDELQIGQNQNKDNG